MTNKSNRGVNVPRTSEEVEQLRNTIKEEMKAYQTINAGSGSGTDIQSIISKENTKIEIMLGKKLEELLSSFSKREISNLDVVRKYNEQVEHQLRSSMAGVGKQIVTQTSYGNVNSATTHGSLSSEAFFSIGSTAQSRREALFKPSSALERSIHQQMVEIQDLGMRASTSLDDPSKQNEISSEIETRRKNIERNKAILREKKLEGFDERQVYKRASGIIEDYELRENKARLINEAAALDPAKAKIEYDRLQGELKRTQSAFGKTQEVYRQATQGEGRFGAEYGEDRRKGAVTSLEKEIEKLTTKMNDLSDATEDAKTKLKYANEQEREALGNLQQGIRAMQTVVRFGQLPFETYKELNFNAPMRQSQALTSVMARRNKLYFDSKDALFNEDVGAMFDAMNFPIAAKYAESKKTDIANKAIGVGDYALSGLKGAAIGAAALSIIGAGLTATGVGAPAGIPMAILGASIGAGVGAANAPSANDAFNGTTSMQQENLAFDTFMNMSKQERAVGLDKAQFFVNQSMKAYRGTQGLGAGGRELRDALTDKQFLSGITMRASEAASLAPILSQAGSFTRDDAGQLLDTAGKAALRGSLTAQQYTSFGANLMGMGGSANDMKEILAGAISKGMDNAKSIGEMVKATMSMSSELASQGIAATSGVQSTILGTVAGLVDSGVNKNLAVGAAASAISDVNGQFKSTDMNLGNVVEMFRLRRAFPNFTSDQMQKAATLGIPEYSGLLRAAGGDAGAAKDATTMLERLGLPVSSFTNEKGDFDVNKISGYMQEGYESGLINKMPGAGPEVTGRARKLLERYREVLSKGSAAEKTSLATELSNIPKVDPALQATFGNTITQMAGQLNSQVSQENPAGIPLNPNDPYFKMQQAQKNAETDMITKGGDFFASLNKASTALNNFADIQAQMAENMVKADTGAASAGMSGSIGADLETGARNFNQIIMQTARQLQAMGMNMEGVIPSSSRSSGTGGDGG